MTIDSVDALLDALRAGGGLDDGEAVDLLDHMLQSAAVLAETAPHDPELQVAGLVHDLGWILGADAAMHARAGALAVEDLLGPRVAGLIAGHDQAKRYLVSTEPSYREHLSEISVATLTLQGGEMGGAARNDFEANELFTALVALRRADDAAKVPGCAVPGLDDWRPLLHRVAHTA